MNDLKVGFTMITTNEYKELILKETELEGVIKDCESQISELEKRAKLFEKKFLDNIYTSEEYHIRNLEFKDGCINKDYHFNQLSFEFTSEGIEDFGYITKKIIEFHERYVDEETKEEETNE